MKSNFISVGKAKKKGYKIVIDQDKVLEAAERGFKDEDIRGSNDINKFVSFPISATQMANMWWQRMASMTIERQILHNVVDEVAEPRRSYVDELIDIVNKGL